MRIYIALFLLSFGLFGCSGGSDLIEKSLKGKSSSFNISGVDDWKEKGMFKVDDIEANRIERNWNMPFRSPALSYLTEIQDRYGFQLANKDAQLARVYCVNRLPLSALESMKTVIPNDYSTQDLFYTHVLIGDNQDQKAWFMVLPTPELEGSNDEIKEGFLRNMDMTFSVKEVRKNGRLIGYSFFDSVTLAQIAVLDLKSTNGVMVGHVQKNLLKEFPVMFKAAFSSIALKLSPTQMFNIQISEPGTE
jgi:hypothetical protein